MAFTSPRHHHGSAGSSCRSRLAAFFGGLLLFFVLYWTHISATNLSMLTAVASPGFKGHQSDQSSQSSRSTPLVEGSTATATYKPAPVEAFIMSHTEELQMTAKPPAFVKTCTIWHDPKASPYYKQLHAFARELKEYYRRLDAFQLDPGIIGDLRRSLPPESSSSSEDHAKFCQQLELHPDGLAAIFETSGQLSQTTAGYVEPLIPPMRHPGLCLEDDVRTGTKKMHILLSLDYLIHDWAELCRQLKPTSRTVFIDMGASLMFFERETHQDRSPSLKLLDDFRKFGFVFDHIYAYELRQQVAAEVYKHVPLPYQSAFHWVNVGVSADPTSIFNPFKMLLESFTENDLIIVKLDIDSPDIERALAEQLRQNPALLDLIDHFYFEHHVNQYEIKNHWGPTKESVEESFQLFTSLRQRGVAAHFWV